jgi:hypothetical protein
LPDKHRGDARDQKLSLVRCRGKGNVFFFPGRRSCVCFDAFVGGRSLLSLVSQSKEQSVRSGRITRALAIGIAGALAMGATTPLYAQLRSNEKAVEQMGLNDRTTPDALSVLGAFQVGGVRHSGPGAYTMRRPDLDGVARNNNKGPDDYFAPRFRDGKCVEDEGNTLAAEQTFGGGVRRMQGKSLERALASLCRKAEENRREPRGIMS